MAVSSPLNPSSIAKERSGGASSSGAQNFITGGSPLGSGVVASAANKIVGFSRAGAAGVAAKPPDLQSIISTLSSNILNNVENRVTSINQNVTQVVQGKLKELEGEHRQRMQSIDAAKPNAILNNFLTLYKEAIGYIQFLGNRNNVKSLGDNLKGLQNVFAEAFNVARAIRQTIKRTVGQLSSLPKATTGGGGLSLDIGIPGAGLRMGGMGKLARAVRKGRLPLMLGGAALAGGLGSKVVSGMMDLGGGDVQGVPMGEGTIPGVLLDKFDGILERFSKAIETLTSGSRTTSSAGASLSSADMGSDEETPSTSPGGPSATPANLEQDAVTDPTAQGQVEAAGFDQSDFATFRDVIASKESGGKYDIQGGSGNYYSGRYQLGPDARADAAKFLGEQYQGDSESARQAFRNDPEMQERYFAAYTRANDSYMRGIPEYDALDKRGKLEVLAYAHNAGAGNAIKWLQSGRGQSFSDGFGTKSDTYAKEVRAAFSGASPPQLQQAAVTADTTQQTKPTVEPAKTQSENNQIAAQTVAQPPPTPETTVSVAPVSAAAPQTQSGGSQKMIPPRQRLEGGASVPFLTSSNNDNFLTLYSRMVYNVVDG